MNAVRPWVIIGNPENRRVRMFQQALGASGQQPAIVFSYGDLLTGCRDLEQIPPDAIVRIDSAGENFQVEKLMLKEGVHLAEQEGAPTLGHRRIDRLGFDRGLITNTRQWFLGYAAVLSRWQKQFECRPDLLHCNRPSEIVTMFDKPASHQICARASVPVPHRIRTSKHVDDLIAITESGIHPHVFVKPAHSSSASGVVALRRRRFGVEAITPIEIVQCQGETRLYNSLKIHRYTAWADIKAMLEVILANHAHVEEWLPKASLGRRVCDLRILVIAGQPRHCVVRTSRSPVTNLHLGNRRGDLTAFLDKVAPTVWRSTMETCALTARLFPGSIQIGLDILFTPGFQEHFLLETNAFGDLLPDVMHNGQDCYQSQIVATLAGDFR